MRATLVTHRIRIVTIVAAGAAAVTVLAIATPAVGVATHHRTAPRTRYVSASEPISGGADVRTLGATRAAGLSPVAGRLTPAGTAVDTWHTEATLPGAVVHDVAFPTATTGYAAAELGQVWKTTDSGMTWSLVLNRGFPFYYYGVDALNANDIVVSGFNDQSGAGILTWSHDGGETWGTDQTLSPNAWVGRIRLVNGDGLAMNGLGASGTAPNAAWYENGGGAWSQVTPDPNGGWFGYQFALLPSQHAYASGITYCTSADTGADWDCGASVDSVFDGATEFVNRTHGWVGGGEISPDVAGWLHRTTDGGQTWSGRVLQTAWPIRQIEFLNNKVGWATGGNVYSGVGGMYATTDGGRTWSLDADTGTEVGACAHHAVMGGSKTRVWCVGFTSANGSFSSTVYRTVVPTP